MTAFRLYVTEQHWTPEYSDEHKQAKENERQRVS